MYTSGIVPDQVVHQFSVEVVAIEQQSFVIVEELFLYRAIESFHVSVHFGSFGVGVVVSNLELEELCCEVFLKLTAVVCQDKSDGVGKQETKHLEELHGCPRGVRTGGPSKSKPPEKIFAGYKVPAGAMDSLLDCIKPNAVPWVLRFEIQWFPRHFLTISLLDLAKVANLLGKQA